ncbi:MAG: TIGR01777 family oxidoreductase, partial [Pirellulaceae bacterium]
MDTFEKRLELPVSPAEAFAWHERPGALDRLLPPWEPVRVLERGDGVRNGSTVKLGQRIGPVRVEWVARHHGYQAGRVFRDTQLSGPFAAWEHRHEFESGQRGGTVLTDHIEYQVPGGSLGRLLGGGVIRRKLAHMFTYRHETTLQDLNTHARYRDRGVMRWAVTGSTGLLGATLLPLLTTGGHEVTRLVRRRAGEGEVEWNPQARWDAAALDGTDAVVHLAGENIAAGRWTAAAKQRIRDSRVGGTRQLCEGLARMTRPPRVLVSASAIGFYGERGDEPLTETSTAGAGFLAEVAQEWEAATRPALEAGIRVVHLRFGMILSPRGGALAKMLPPFQWGGGGRVGGGRQYWSWIAIDDAAAAVHHAVMCDALAGPVNAVSPQPVTNAEFTATLGRVLRRPTIVPLPGFAARMV